MEEWKKERDKGATVRFHVVRLQITLVVRSFTIRDSISV
jgi:hypothetical protein